MTSLVDVSDYYASQKKVIKQIISPLSKHYGVDNFGYQQVTDEGMYWHLNSHKDWSIEYAKQEYAIISPSIIDINLLQNLNYKASDYQDDEVCQKLYSGFQDYLEITNIRFCLIKNQNNYEIFCLGSYDNANTLLDSLITQPKTFNSFYKFFHQETASLHRDFAHYHVDIAAAKGRAFFQPDCNNRIISTIHGLGCFDDEIESMRLSVWDRCPVKLSNREKECLLAVCSGKTSREIANDLSLSSRTVEGYIASLRNKFDVGTSIELIQIVMHHNLI